MLIAGALESRPACSPIPSPVSLKWAGIAYLLFISWQLARLQVTGDESPIVLP
jgi:hypothetical protein